MSSIPDLHDDLEHSGAEAIVERLLATNPFLVNAVNDPSETEGDVATIHRREFEDLVAYAEEALRQRTHIGQIVWGEAGIGKSHLLARLCAWAAENDRAACVFLHNIQPSPEHLPAYVLKCVVQRLVRGRCENFHDTPLYCLLRNAVQRAIGEFPQNRGIPSARDARASFHRLVDRVLAESANAGPDARTIYEVLFWFFIGSYNGRYHGNEYTARVATRWLQGDDLDHEEAKSLEMRCGDDPDRPVALPGTQAVESVLIALAELAALSNQPFILVFDQIDNLTPEQLTALTQFLHPLIDHARNLLVVCSGVQSKLLDHVEKGVVYRAAWERLAQDERGVRLGRIDRQQARQLVELRLAGFHRSLPDCDQAVGLRGGDRLFPLGAAWFEQRLGEQPQFRPRDIINWARDRWREQQRRARSLAATDWIAQWAGDEAAAPAAELAPEQLAERIDEQVARKIGRQVDRRRREPETLPADAGNMAGLAESLLRQCLGEGNGYGLQRVDRVEPHRSGRQPAYHLMLCSQKHADGPALHTGMTFIATANRVSAAAVLRRIVEDPQPPQRVVVVSEERLPVSLGARGEDYLTLLRERGPERFATLEISFAEYAELDGLQAAVGDARTGDLEVDLPGGAARRVSEDEVIASHHRRDRYREQRLLRLLLE